MNHADNTLNLIDELNWLCKLIRFRKNESESKNSFTTDNGVRGISEIVELSPPDLRNEHSVYAKFVYEHELSFELRLLLILTLANHISPKVLAAEFETEKGGYTDTWLKNVRTLGGASSNGGNSWFLPSGLTYLFIVAGADWQQRLSAQQVFFSPNVLAEKGIIQLEPHYRGEPTLSGGLVMNEDWVEYLTVGLYDRDKASIKYGLPKQKVKGNEEPFIT